MLTLSISDIWQITMPITGKGEPMGIIKQFMEYRKMTVLSSNFKEYTAYSPNFTTYQGGLYEMDLTRSAIHAIAINASKANPIVVGNVYKNLTSILQNNPNQYMTTQQFLYKVFTILTAENNCYIIPIYEDRSAGKIIGLYPITSKGCKIVSVDGTLMLNYRINSLKTTMLSIPYDEVGHLKNHFYENDFNGNSNSALSSTMELINTQNQGIINGVKQSAMIRFMMKFSNVIASPEKYRKERDELKSVNLNSENNGGIFMYDGKYSDAKQIDSKPFIVDAEQSAYIKNNIYNYFGVNEKILQNSFNEDEWNAFYEGKLEPDLIQLSQVISKMLFDDKQLANGSKVFFESSRMQYASNTTKLNIVTQLFDRGFITHNQGLQIFNLPPVEDGDKTWIRREYAEVGQLTSPVATPAIVPQEVQQLDTQKEGTTSDQ